METIEATQKSWDVGALFSDDTPEDRDFRAEVRAWVKENLPPELGRRRDRFVPTELRPWHRKLYERGWIAPHWPKQYGGMGATLTQQIILFEEFARAGAPTPYAHGLNFIGPIIIAVGTEAQKQRFLPGILSGDSIWCQGYSEAGAGSDLASLTTKAELDGDHFTVNGHKMWTTNGHYADWMFALVRTDPDAKPRHAGITMLLIDMRSPGITIRPIQTLKGDAEFAEEFFDNVRVPRENVLGEINQGWRVAGMVLGGERFTTGHPRYALVYLNQARQIAKATGAWENPAFRARLAELEIDLLAFLAYYRHAAKLHTAGVAPVSQAPVIKIAGGTLAQRSSELLMLASGTEAPSTGDFPLESGPVSVVAELLEMRRVSVGSGTMEINRNIIAKRALGLPDA